MRPTTQCTVCEHETRKPDPFFYDWHGRRFWIYRCRRCTHQFVHPPVTPEDQALIYSDQYFSKEGDWACGFFGAGYIEAEPHLREEAHQVLAMLPVSSGRLLDVGCAGGIFLDEARKLGFAVAGIELNRSLAEYAVKTLHVDILNGRIEEVPEKQWSAPFDVVTVLDCLEHLPQPLAAMKKISDWLRPGGMVFIRGPLSNSPVVHFKEKVRRVLHATKHLPGYPLDANTFNKRSLQMLLTASGFEGVEWIGEVTGFSNLLARKRRS